MQFIPTYGSINSKSTPPPSKQRKNVGGEWQVKTGKVVSGIPKVVRTMISCDEFAILLDSATKL